MKTTSPRRRWAWAVRCWMPLAVAVLAGSCASPEKPGVRFVAAQRPATPWDPATARVGIISTSPLPVLRIQWPQRRREAMREAERETANLLYQTSMFWPAAFAAVPYISAQAASASLSGLSEEAFQRAWETYGTTLQQMLVHDGLRRTVADQARARGATNFFLVEKPYPPGPRAQFDRMAYFIAATLAWLPKRTTAADYLREHHAEVVLELVVSHASLAGKPGTNRPLALSFDLDARLLSLETGAVQARLQLQYRGVAKRFAEWMEQGGEPFLVELQTAYLACADRILDWCGNVAPPSDRAPDLAKRLTR